MIESKIEPQPGEGGGIKTINQKGPGLQKEDPGGTIPDRDPGFESRDLRNLQVLPRTWLDMLGGVAHGVVESTRRFGVEYAREWQPADERSAARLSEALGRLSASINSHDVTLLEKPGGRCSLLKGTAPRWPFLAAPAWEARPLARVASRAEPPAKAAHAAAVTAHQRCGGCCYLSGLCPFCNMASALLRREQLARGFSLHVSDLLHDEREGLKAMLRADADADAAEQALTYPV